MLSTRPLGSQRQREEGVDVFIKLHEIQSQRPIRQSPIYPPEGGRKPAGSAGFALPAEAHMHR